MYGAGSWVALLNPGRARSEIDGRPPALEVRVEHVAADEAVLQRGHLLEASKEKGTLAFAKKPGPVGQHTPR